MRYPALNDLIKKADNKYSLCLATAKRAREIVEGDEPLVKIKIDNPVSIATMEISEEMVHCIHHVENEDETIPDKSETMIVEEEIKADSSENDMIL
jgi:DNA-directed RNA polymerase subunit omega